MTAYLSHYNLQHHNTLASPVTARFFTRVTDEGELKSAINFARERHLPLLILGGGSNVVLRDDFPGLAIHIQLLGKHVVKDDADCVYVRAAAGENWHRFVEYCLQASYWGLENLSLIPGSVGAAPIQNIGAYGVELEAVFSELTALDVNTGVSITFSKSDCEFSYRDSIFKAALRDKYIITSVTFKLTKVQHLHITYPALQQALAGYDQKSINAQLVSKLVCEIRQTKLPSPAQVPNVGSFFKNPIISKSLLADIQSHYPAVVFYPVNTDQVKLAAGWLIDCAGWKGGRDCGAAVHDSQALVLTNPNRLKADAVLDLAEKIQQSVFSLFAVTLEIEPRIYPALSC